MGQRLLALMLAVMAASAIVSCGNDTDTAVTTTISTTTALSTTEATTTSTPTASTSTASTSTDGTTTTTTQPTVDDLVLSADGLGVVDFSTEAEEALAQLVRVLGPPSLDTGWWDPSDYDGDYAWIGCPGTVARVATWDGVMGVVLTDWDQDADETSASSGRRYLAGAALHRSSPVTTIEGARSSDTLGRLREIYGTRLWVSGEPGDDGLYSFAVDEETSRFEYRGGVRGTLHWPGYPDGLDSETEPPVPPADPVIADDWTARFLSGVDCVHT